ncbi:uncharacterized protein PRCAT00000386001 [Priceomyces carsonii]|uniref:uncharacterized protein n=1 Tax=Priceomyces carsonii TaxID=28549 RepID=UPI002EDB3700|nr:unnamed protein product [Priceomyces carsonii]
MASSAKVGAESENEGSSPLPRSISVDSIAPKLTSLFKRNRKRKIDESAESTPGPSDSENEANEQESKKRKVLTEEQKKFDEEEAKRDAALPENLRKFRPKGFGFNLPPKDRPIRIYADGVFDLFHLGHMKQLEQAKKSFPNVELVCGVATDVDTHKRKGMTVLTDKQRMETLKHCKWVDEVVSAPWIVTPEFLKEHRIDYVAHDDLPYASLDSDDIYKPIKERGMFMTTQRTEGISTSDIITKIIRDYDKYLMRNFSRGATRKELNVSWFKKNELEFKKQINDFRGYWMKNKANINNVSRDLYFEVREYMRGKRSELSSLLDNVSNYSSLPSDYEDNTSKASSPLTDFASKYVGNANKDMHPNKSLLANVKDWIKGDDSNDEYSTNDEHESKKISNLLVVSTPDAPDSESDKSSKLVSKGSQVKDIEKTKKGDVRKSRRTSKKAKTAS